jgi:peptidoglycan/xylan/chitin deacetylase (PgdA/CDA1 family)
MTNRNHLITSTSAHNPNVVACMLTFHRVAAGPEWQHLPNRDFYLNLDYLSDLLNYLKRSAWTIVTIDEMLAELARQNGKRRLVNFSIDDGYADTVEHAIPLFRSFAAPITVFITTGIPDGTDLLGRAGLETILAEREAVLTQAGKIQVSEPRAKRYWFKTLSSTWEQANFDQAYRDFCQINGENIETLRNQHAITWSMLHSLRNDPLLEIGAHTISHPRVSNLSASAALQELAGSAERLRSRLAIPCRHFAFPYGRAGDCSDRDFILAREAGFVSAATTVRGLVRPGQDLFRLPRNNMNGAYQSIAYAKVSLSGLGGLIAKALRML